MKNLKKIVSIILAAAFIMTVASACGKTAGKDDTSKKANDTKTAGTISTDGSTSMEKVIGALGEAFESDTGAKFTYNPTGSGSGITAVLKMKKNLRALKKQFSHSTELQSSLTLKTKLRILL